ncbi:MULTISPECIES: TIGR03750 family conjugal transfer protein [unclassified Photorhabdus]|uniref:TIGR03750 family conjugal transfer protein n=1 Tax=unclassified Photorhabdus TaxID=2620880 RepID=UPI000DCE07FC|nr:MULTISPECIES: TIGR03750 family conjugal transfer protein [unclassified Photorhabdus]RAW71953.1 TIGR03750 family conjugal transfer protein [Photorhabdus sp. S7-51]RAW73548.1 TIGR03750 family conjugal transfer protein [Photorhabdus sp. S14-60]RAW78482.1 TIGR03750 family conjugal transfer protein [Photorhabdus sp. S15-56]HEN3291956.1 TIGR03750 family conjugal transfer protein [Yersinia enterocolitica]
MASIDFLPDRLNREPSVFRGLTTSELFIAFLLGFFSGLFFGVIPAVALQLWPLIPTCALIFAALAILWGGKYFARLKRGRPDTWLYLAIAAWFARRGFGDTRLIQFSTIWSIKRS